MIKFEKLPYSVRAILAAGMGLKLSAGRYGTEFARFSAFLADSIQYGLAEQTAWQKTELLSLVESAKTGTAHYNSLALDRELDFESLVRSLPVLEKHELRRAPEQFFNRNVKKWLVSATSGTSGSPMKVEHCKSSMQRRFALLKQHLEFAGVSKNSPSVRLSGRIIADPSKEISRPWLYVPTENQLLVSSYHLNADHQQTISQKLSRFAPEVMDGYSSGVLETLRLMDRAGVKLSSLKAIVTTAETLSPAVREELESLSGAKVLDYYAASEGVPIIQQCKYGTYHVRWESGIFEVVVDGNTAFEGDGELVVTSFIQDRTPLIRYRTGDYVKGLSHQNQNQCGCGMRTPTIASVEGRIEDMVLVRGGKRMGMFTYRTLKEVSGLHEAQVVQRDYDDFCVRAVLADGAESTEVSAAVKDKFERALGYPITLEFQELSEIPKGANGKLRLVVNEMLRKGGVQG
ncbi:hypothetical protein [Marinobacter sp. M-5]|uniref:phenylacetate--CoA ligase family protein n=1 Tax=Marinobacter sp. M-5 TaxID=3081089 RepID=UPI00293C42AA|nr:hypothetical protein [Marinobacter sp. M-5]MDV3503096.1 hypothetical protein [Marinobacter sp. M-5]